jgi:hypothetical protein
MMLLIDVGQSGNETGVPMKGVHCYHLINSRERFAGYRINRKYAINARSRDEVSFI